MDLKDKKVLVIGTGVSVQHTFCVMQEHGQFFLMKMKKQTKLMLKLSLSMTQITLK